MGGWLQGWGLGKCIQDLEEFFLEPWMQDGIGAVGHAFDPHLAGQRMKECQDLGGSITDIFVRLPERSPFWLPAGSRIRNGGSPVFNGKR